MTFYVNIVRKQGAATSVTLGDLKKVLAKYQTLAILGQEFKVYRTKLWASLVQKNIPEGDKAQHQYLGEVRLTYLKDMESDAQDLLFRTWRNRKQKRKDLIDQQYAALLNNPEVLWYNVPSVYQEEHLHQAKKRDVCLNLTMPSTSITAFLKEIAPIVKRYQRKGKIKTGWVPPGTLKHDEVTKRYWSKLK